MAIRPSKPRAAKRAAAKETTVRLMQLSHSRGLPLPAYQTLGAAGMDLVAALAEASPVLLLPRTRALIPTGLVMELPAGFEAQVRPRSGLALKHGVTVLNSPGTIDPDYRGEVQVILVNLGSEPFEIRRGERIAQMVIQPVVQARLIKVEAVSDTDRGAGGFGSTGQKASAKPKLRAKPAEKPPQEKKAVPRKAAKTKRPARPIRGSKPAKTRAR